MGVVLIFFTLFVFGFWICVCNAGIHTLDVNQDSRKYIFLSTFGFLQGGFLNVKLKNFRVAEENEKAIFGFSLHRAINGVMNPYLNKKYCMLIDQPIDDAEVSIFLMDLKEQKMHVKCDKAISYNNNMNIDSIRKTLFRWELDIIKTVDHDNHNYYSTNFTIHIDTIDEGFYSLYFYNCPNYDPQNEIFVDFHIEITEYNLGSFLSAGEMLLPDLYCMMAVLFLLSGMFWVVLLHRLRHSVFKIHYMMAVLVFLKAMSLTLQCVNYHYIERLGVRLTIWVVLYYAIHLVKSVLLVTVLVLVGSGLTFIKDDLATREKVILFVVIPLRILANIAEIIMKESDKEGFTGRQMFIATDVLSWVFVLFPAVWSMKHLRKLSLTSYQAALDLKLFRQFYFMIVCFIYTSTIIVYLLEINVPYQNKWLIEMFKEEIACVFFVLTAFKFRPRFRPVSEQTKKYIDRVLIPTCVPYTHNEKI